MMLSIFKKALKRILPNFLKNQLSKLILLNDALQPIAKRKCNICDYHGYFSAFGRPVRLDAKCPNCESLERHRLMMLAFQRNEIPLSNLDTISVLHFAPEYILENIFRKKFKNYKTADLYAKADIKINMEKIDLPSGEVDLIIANHVLEHVDDKKASRELSRILSSSGILLCQVPIIEAWEKTYENEKIKTESERWLHFGQGDHIRYYGKDFRKRIENGGFTLIKEVTAFGEDAVKYGLKRGEKLFIFKKN